MALNDQTDPNDPQPDAPGDPWTPDELAAVQSWAQQWYTDHQIPSSYGVPSDIVNNWMSLRRSGVADDAARTQTLHTLGWDAYTPTAPTTTTPPAPGPSGGGSGNQNSPDIYHSPLTAPYPGVFTAPTPINIGGPAGVGTTPTFTGDKAPPMFKAPSVADALNDPGYQFRVQEGDKGIQNWAGARGTLLDSSTPKALSDYNQNAASQEYADVWNRAMGTFTNSTLPGWMTSIYNPTMTAYSTNAAAVQHQNDVNYANVWNQYLDAENQYYNWQNNVWAKLFQSGTA